MRQNFRKIRRHNFRNPHVPLDYDLLITSGADFAWRRDYVGTIEHPAAHEGIELSAA